jgi:hypothetical protein
MGAGSFTDQATESLHASMAQIIAEVKGLAARVTSLSEGEAERGKVLEQLLTRVEGIETRMNGLEGSVNEDTEARARRSSAKGSKRTSNEHPLLKVCRDTMSHMPSMLRTSARDPHNLFSDVWGGGIRAQRETYR